jgi:hypothetical protein
MSKIEEACGPLGFNVRKQNYKVCGIFFYKWLVMCELMFSLEFALFMELMFYTSFILDFQMKLKGDKTGRKGHLSVATEVLALALCSVLQFWSISC